MIKMLALWSLPAVRGALRLREHLAGLRYYPRVLCYFGCEGKGQVEISFIWYALLNMTTLKKSSFICYR